MKKIIRLNENDLESIIQKVLSEQGSMFGTAGTNIPGYRKDDPRNPQKKVVTPRVEDINPKKLKMGDGGRKNPKQSEDVKILQRKLMKLGHLVISEPTGYFGELTQKALDNYNSRSKVVTARKSKKMKPGLLISDCVKNSPKAKENYDSIEIDDYEFYDNQKVKLPDGRMATYFCYKNGVKLKTEEGKKYYLETGVETKEDETSMFDGGIGGFFRRKAPNVAQILFTKPLTEKDFSESQKQVIFDTIQNAIKKRNLDPKRGCVEYRDYTDPSIDAQLNRTGGATTGEMILGTGMSDQFRIATTLGQFCYSLTPQGNYTVTDDYDFHKWKQFTVKKGELEGKTYPEKIGYIMAKTGLSPYGAIRHLGWLEHPDNAPAATKTKIVINIVPGYYAKQNTKKPSSGDPSDVMV